MKEYKSVKPSVVFLLIGTAFLFILNICLAQLTFMTNLRLARSETLLTETKEKNTYLRLQVSQFESSESIKLRSRRAGFNKEVSVIYLIDSKELAKND